MSPEKCKGKNMEPWIGMANHTTEGVCGLVSQYRWDNIKRLIRELVDIEENGEEGLYRYNM